MCMLCYSIVRILFRLRLADWGRTDARMLGVLIDNSNLSSITLTPFGFLC